MVKVAWKTIKGYGPYAYLQHSIKDQDGTVTSKHLAYLGKLGAGGLFPGHHLTISAKQAQGFGGGRVRVPYVPSELQENLKPQGQVLTQSIHAQVESGTPLKQVDTTLAFAQKSATAGKPPAPTPAQGDKKELGATPPAAEPKAATGQPSAPKAEIKKAPPAGAPGKPKAAPAPTTAKASANKGKAASSGKTTGTKLPTPAPGPGTKKELGATPSAAEPKAAAGQPSAPAAEIKQAPPTGAQGKQPAAPSPTAAKAPAKQTKAAGSTKGKTGKPAAAAKAKTTGSGKPTGIKPAASKAPAASKKLGATPPGLTPQLGDISKDAKGHALISAANVKKLQQAAAKAAPALDQLSQQLQDQLVTQPKKAAIANAVAELKAKLTGIPIQEGESGSGLPGALKAVKTGGQKLPHRQAPSSQTIQEQDDRMAKGVKDWDGDLEQVSGKKGSNEGGLFKDQKLQSLHYVKWSGSDARARVEALVGLLYTYAGVPVPITRPIRFQGQTAVMSDWVNDASPMSLDQMKKHPDVRENFAVDAWLANWDVVGMSADNIVQGEGGQAYRIDLGGSLIFRAQGKGKHLPADVPELETLLLPGTNPNSAQVFANLSSKELKAGVNKLAQVSDQQVDHAVDLMKIPRTSAQYPASQFGDEARDLPAFLKQRLKERRDFIVQEVLNAEARKQESLAQLKKHVALRPGSLELVAGQAKSLQHQGSATTKKELQASIMEAELGKAQGKASFSAVASAYSSWKGSTNTPGGRFLRWGVGEVEEQGDRELRRMQDYNQFLEQKGLKTKAAGKAELASLQKQSAGKDGPVMVQGLKVTREANHAVARLQHPGKKTVTIYRTWTPDQVEYLGLKTAKVGDAVTLEDPPAYSWTFDPGVFSSAGHGSIRVRSQVPVDKLVLTDRVNNTTGSFAGEDEVVFKGIKNHQMEVTKT